MKIELEVTMDSGQVHKVVADGRDWAKMEVQDFPEAAMLTRSRFLAWSVMTRQQLTSVPWQRFNEVECADVETPNDPDESEEAQGLDPGRATPSGTSA